MPTANRPAKRNLTPPCSRAFRIAVKVDRSGMRLPISKALIVVIETFARSARSLWDQFNQARAARLSSGVTASHRRSPTRGFPFVVLSEATPAKAPTEPSNASRHSPRFGVGRKIAGQANALTSPALALPTYDASPPPILLESCRLPPAYERFSLSPPHHGAAIALS
jgi:hypothetical protein